MTQIPLPSDTAEVSPQQNPEEFVSVFIAADYDGTSTDIPGTTGVRAVLPQMHLPSWVTITDYTTKYFINSHSLYSDLIKCLSIIEFIFDKKCKATIFLRQEQEEQDEEYVVIAIKPSKKQEEAMADYLFECNRQLASSLSFCALPFIVLTME